MQKHDFTRIILLVALTAILCGIAGAVTVGAEPHETSGASAPACTAPCECISEKVAIQRWGVNGYEMCSKTICGQSADAMEQYYCIHQIGSAAAGAAPAQAQPPAGPAAAAQAAGSTQKAPMSAVSVVAALGCMILAGAGHYRK